MLKGCVKASLFDFNTTANQSRRAKLAAERLTTDTSAYLLFYCLLPLPLSTFHFIACYLCNSRHCNHKPLSQPLRWISHSHLFAFPFPKSRERTKTVSHTVSRASGQSLHLLGTRFGKLERVLGPASCALFERCEHYYHDSQPCQHPAKPPST